MTLTLGIDDAGRGPVIGSMILAGVLLDKNSETILKKYNITDSKLLTHPFRVSLAKLIKESALNFHIVKSTPEEIDSAVESKLNLNTLEAIKAAEIINALNDNKSKIQVIVDCPSVNTKKWRTTLISFIKHSENLNIKCEHKADFNHFSVSAASIIAKVTREEEVEKIKKQYGEIGSGYPSDPYTKDFLKTHGKSLSSSGIFRKSWATWKNMFPENSIDSKKKGQSTLF